MVSKPNLYWDIMRCQTSSLRVQGRSPNVVFTGERVTIKDLKASTGVPRLEPRLPSVYTDRLTEQHDVKGQRFREQWASLWLCMCLFKEKLLKWYKKLQNPVTNVLSLQQRGKQTHNVKLKRWDDKHLHMKKIESVISLNNKPLQVGLCLII